MYNLFKKYIIISFNISCIFFFKYIIVLFNKLYVKILNVYLGIIEYLFY